MPVTGGASSRTLGRCNRKQDEFHPVRWRFLRGRVPGRLYLRRRLKVPDKRTRRP